MEAIPQVCIQVRAYSVGASIAPWMFYASLCLSIFTILKTIWERYQTPHDPARDVETALKGLLEHGASPELLRAHVQALVDICSSNGALGKKVAEQGGLELLLQCMRRYPENHALTQTACMALSAVCKKMEGAQKAVEVGAIGDLLALVERKPPPKVVRFTLLSLRGIVSRDDDICKAAVEAGALPVVLGAMTQHRKDAAVQESGLDALANIAGAGI